MIALCQPSHGRKRNIDNILDTVMYSDGTCKKIYELIIKKKYNQMPTSQMSWPGGFENENIELSWEDIYRNIYKSTIQNNLRYFQLKLIHRCLPRQKE